jgi:pyridoxal phosphate-dependent aminotransferase EpsN
MQKYKFYAHSENEDIAAKLYNTGLYLPSGSNLASNDMERVISCIHKCFTNY